MKIAIVGAGLAGLGILLPLLQASPHIQVTLFDPQGIGGGASGVSTGLLHPFPGRRALRSWEAEAGMRATEERLALVASAMKCPIAAPSGILRLAMTESQKKDFRQLESDPDALWWDEAKVASLLPRATPAPGLFVQRGSVVYTELYLKGLWELCLGKGAILERQKIESLQELEEFDAIVLTTGAETLHFKECSHLQIRPTKGQTLLCRWEEKLPLPLLSQGHITPTSDPEICQIGSTYERAFTSLKPEPEIALTLLEKAAQFYPPARNFEVVEIRAAARIARIVGYRPIVEKISPKAWVFTGLGSRGMLYHAWLGERLAQTILESR